MESKDFKDLFQEFKTYEETKGVIPNRITTLSDIEDFIIQYSTLFPVAEDRKQKQFNPPLKSAVVASRPMETVIAGMLKSLNMNKTIVIQVFNTFSEAKKWIHE
jgi:hypothetical protein